VQLHGIFSKHCKTVYKGTENGSKGKWDTNIVKIWVQQSGPAEDIDLFQRIIVRCINELYVKSVYLVQFIPAVVVGTFHKKNAPAPGNLHLFQLAQSSEFKDSHSGMTEFGCQIGCKETAFSRQQKSMRKENSCSRYTTVARAHPAYALNKPGSFARLLY